MGKVGRDGTLRRPPDCFSRPAFPNLPSFVIRCARCVSLFNLPVANSKPALLNQRYALHENYTRYGYHCFSRSH
jgi:hypothetical protein